MLAVETEGLSKSFRVRERKPGMLGVLRRGEVREVEAVKDLSFQVAEGEMLAFIGPNGAGKSTTIKMLTGILHPSGGRARVLGMTPWKERQALAFRIGAVFGQRSQLWYHLAPDESFELLSRIYELPRGYYRRRRRQLIDWFDLGPILKQPVRKLSLGQRMRCEVAAALLHGPRILFLDEPTIGLDVIVKQRIRELIRRINREEGVTLFLTSHDVGDIEDLCKRAMIINHGRVIYDDRVSALRRDQLAYKVIDLAAAGVDDVQIEAAGVEILKRSGHGLKLRVDTRLASIDEVLGALLRTVRVKDITISDPPLEETISRLYRGETAS